jgi:hypothetical protein
VGVSFIIATVAGILTAVLWGPILEEPDNLINVSANENQVIIGALFYFIMAVAVAGIAIVIYPVLKKHNEALALGYVGARIVEGVFFIVHIITVLTLLTLSQEFVKAGAPDASYFQTSGELLLAAGDWAGNVLAGLVFSLSALMLYYLLYQSKLIPRWLSGWGLIGAILYPAASVSLFGSTISNLFYIPLAVNEMVLAIWLIVKGFNSSAVASESAKADINEV